MSLERRKGAHKDDIGEFASLSPLATPPMSCFESPISHTSGSRELIPADPLLNQLRKYALVCIADYSDKERFRKAEFVALLMRDNPVTFELLASYW